MLPQPLPTENAHLGLGERIIAGAGRANAGLWRPPVRRPLPVPVHAVPVPRVAHGVVVIEARLGATKPITTRPVVDQALLSPRQARSVSVSAGVNGVGVGTG
jgi:hypothetical protein